MRKDLPVINSNTMPFLRNAPLYDLFEPQQELRIFWENGQVVRRQKRILPRYIRPVHLFVDFNLIHTTYLQVVNNSSLAAKGVLQLLPASDF